MAVIPVGTGLVDAEAVFEGLTGWYAGEAQTRNAVHVGGNDDSVPVERGRDVEPVFDTDGNGVALPPAQERPGDLAIDRGGHPPGAGEVHFDCGDFEVELGAGQDGAWLVARGHSSGRQ